MTQISGAELNCNCGERPALGTRGAVYIDLAFAVPGLRSRQLAGSSVGECRGLVDRDRHDLVIVLGPD
jgi:hypothetical protein